MIKQINKANINLTKNTFALNFKFIKTSFIMQNIIIFNFTSSNKNYKKITKPKINEDSIENFLLNTETPKPKKKISTIIKDKTENKKIFTKSNNNKLSSKVMDKYNIKLDKDLDNSNINENITPINNNINKFVNIPNINIPSVTIVNTKDKAFKVLKILLSYQNRFHSWDTETIDINPKEESPVFNGKVICLSCFIGPDVDFGNGPRLFIDNYGECEGIINIFKDYFEDKTYYKVWHNYGFDRHIIYNHGINVR